MENLVRLAEQGNIDAMVDLGEKCINGEDGFDFYETTVANWFNIAARQGHAKGQYYLALCYEDGFGVVQNYFHAYLYYKKAAEQGYSDAMTNLGLCYYLGQGTPKNYKEAMNWWEKAANLGNAMALYNLGGRYLAGEIVEKNLSKAKELFRQAAELGCEMASKALAKMNGEDIVQKHIDFEIKEYTPSIDLEAKRFSYSIDVAAKIYKHLTTQEEADKEFYDQLKTFFIKKGKKFDCLERNVMVGLKEIIYKNEKQIIYVFIQQSNNKPYVSSIMLPICGEYTRDLFEEGLSNKCLFGLPIFSMQWFDEADKAFIYFINRESYLKYDTPQGRREKELLGF